MSLDTFLNTKPRKVDEKMDLQNPEKQSSLPWVEKYRPNKLDEITFQDEVTSSLRNVLKTGNLPHLLFYGAAGTGKTSAIIALSKQLYGPKFYKQRVLELNASDQRGINVIREKVKKFAREVCVKNIDKTFKCPNFKIIILDEADLMTNQAQSALRRVIEDNSASTRFCIICNYITKIIEPLASRCVKFRFKPIPLQAQLQKLNFICENQGIKLKQDQITALIQKGDLRQSINSLQSFQSLNIIPSQLLPVTAKFVDDLMNKLRCCSNIKQVYECGQQLIYKGYASDQILNVLSRVIIQKQPDERKKAIILEILSKAEQSLLLGATQLPIIEVLTSIYYVINLQL